MTILVVSRTARGQGKGRICFYFCRKNKNISHFRVFCRKKYTRFMPIQAFDFWRHRNCHSANYYKRGNIFNWYYFSIRSQGGRRSNLLRSLRSRKKGGYFCFRCSGAAPKAKISIPGFSAARRPNIDKLKILALYFVLLLNRAIS